MRPPLTDEDGAIRELRAEDFKHMRPLAEVHPALIEAIKAMREKQKGEQTKVEQRDNLFNNVTIIANDETIP